MLTLKHLLLRTKWHTPSMHLENSKTHKRLFHSFLPEICSSGGAEFPWAESLGAGICSWQEDRIGSLQNGPELISLRVNSVPSILV